jgi:FKBP-type peptidyl-prolyl cis-trans isomerase (trigger factor)
MSQIEHHGLVMPTSPEDRKRLKAALNEMVNSLTRIKAEQEQKKAIAAQIVEDFDIPKKLINKAANAMYKENFQLVAAEAADLETLMETLDPSTNNTSSDNE